MGGCDPSKAHRTLQTRENNYLNIELNNLVIK